MNIGVTGSRTRSDIPLLLQCLSMLPKDSILITGGATGIDSECEMAAKELSLTIEIVRPDRTAIQNHASACRAYHERNAEIVRRSDIVLAFPPSDRKGGTENTIKHAKKYDKPLFIYEAANTAQNNLQLAALAQAVSVNPVHNKSSTITIPA